MLADLWLEGLAIFAAVAVLQLPGKSNFGVIALASRHPHGDVFFGASAGLGAATVVSVSLGYALEHFLASDLAWVRLAGGLVLIAFGVREVLKGPSAVREPGAGTLSEAHTARQVQLLAAGLVFLLEMGDNTQILAILFVASTGNVLLVFVAAFSALVVVTALSAASAARLRERVPEERLRLILGGVLMAVGLLTILFTFYPQVFPTLG